MSVFNKSGRQEVAVAYQEIIIGESSEPNAITSVGTYSVVDLPENTTLLRVSVGIKPLLPLTTNPSIPTVLNIGYSLGWRSRFSSVSYPTYIKTSSQVSSLGNSETVELLDREVIKDASEIIINVESIQQRSVLGQGGLGQGGLGQGGLGQGGPLEKSSTIYLIVEYITENKSQWSQG